jgi:conjugative relaxase-like TrwC/TraI family protein
MLSIAPGYDPKYLTRAVGRGAENYYLAAVVEHGEPAGRWWGLGAEALGLAHGTEVDGAVMEPLYEDFLDPRDPEFASDEVPVEDKARLGRKKSQFKDWQEIYAKAAASEPEASPERLRVLQIKAKREARQAVIHHDATFSPAKSVTLVHAGLLASALKAERNGDMELAEGYRKAAGVVEDAVMAGAAASLRYLQENAGEARVGYHGTSTEQRSTGRWMEAGGWVVARFLQHTNREGEPQLHVHQAILNRQLCADGKWRALDGKALYRARPGAAAIGERVMEEQLSRRLGLEFVSRPDGQGREVKGVSAELIASFSSRRAQVTEDLQKRIDAYVAAHGHPPTARAIFLLAQHATKGTKQAKTKGQEAPSLTEELAAWEKQTTDQEIQRLSNVPAETLGRIPQGAPAPELDTVGIRQVLDAALADVQMGKNVWSRHDLTRAINRYLPDYLGGLHEEYVEAVLAELTDLALDPSGSVRVLNAPDVINVPDELRRADGTSIYQAPGFERFVLMERLDAEIALAGMALRLGAPSITAEQATELIGLTHEQAHAARLAGEQIAEGRRLFTEQAAAITGVLTSGRRADVLVGAAGTGKSFTVAKLAEAWRTQFGSSVLGLTTSQNAAGVLHREGLDDASNIAKWLQAVDAGEASVQVGQLIVVDEASMVTNEHMERIHQLAAAANAKVVLTGDDAQLAAPGAGGAMRYLAQVGGSLQLKQVVRFRAEWERDASLLLRDGLPEAISTYDHHGRIEEGTREEMQTKAYQRFMVDHLSGKQALLLAPTNEAAAALSARVHADLVTLGHVQEGGATLIDGNQAGIGDLVVARQNQREDGGEDYLVTNREVIEVAGYYKNGNMAGRVLDEHGNFLRSVELDRGYVEKHVELAYAGTVHAAQGRTVDGCHAVVDDSVTRQMLYVMATRGADGNFLYVVVDQDRQADLRTGPEQYAQRSRELIEDGARTLGEERPPLGVEQGQVSADRFAVLNGVLQNDQADQTAVEAMLGEGDRPRNLAHLGSMWIDQIREGTADAYIHRAERAGLLTAADAERLRGDEAKGTLGNLLRQVEMSGRSADEVFADAITQRDFEGLESLAKGLHARITKTAESQGLDLDRLEVAEEQIHGTFGERTPDLGVPWRNEFVNAISTEMDIRQYQLGVDALDAPPVWLVEEIGEPGEDMIERGDWAARAGEILGYREQYGHQATTDLIGPAPSRQNPEQRAAWMAAHDALGSPDVSREIIGATDGELWVMRARYEREAAWAPPYVADELRRVSIEAKDRAGEAVILREKARAASVDDPAAAERYERRAAAQQALADAAANRQGVLETVHEAREQWHAATDDARIMAMRADSELRRRDHIDHERLPVLHVDPADRARAAAPQPQPAPTRIECEGQLALDLSSSTTAQRADAWQRQPETPETSRWQQRLDWAKQQIEKLTSREVAQEQTAQSTVEILRKQTSRIEWELAQAQRAQQRPDHEHAPERETAPTVEQAEPERAQEREATPVEPERAEIDGQQMLDIFTGLDVDEAPRVDRQQDPQLAEALDSARAARQIAEVRQAERTNELGQELAEQERRRAEREAANREVEQERVQERTAAERERVQQQGELRPDGPAVTGRAAAARSRSTTGAEPTPKTQAEREQSQQAHRPPPRQDRDAPGHEM